MRGGGRRWWGAIGLVVGVLVPAARAAFVNFESGHVRPLALSPSGARLFAVNTPDNRLSIFDVSTNGLTLVAEVPVGLEPVAVAARTDQEVWVVNHLSDSVSVVTIDATDVRRSRVTRTLLTCDEPRDIVFAGPGRTRAFITAARRGQNCPVAAASTTAGVGRALVMVYDATALGAPLGGTPLTTITLFGDTPRALAATPDGSAVYAAVFQSGNRSTAINADAVTAAGGPPPPPAASTPGAPRSGLIVQRAAVSGRWEDERGALGPDWNPQINFDLPDLDVFRIDATANPPVPTTSVAGVGTTLFNLAVRPDNGHVFVSNLDARNAVRFEPMLRGHLAENRITVIDGAIVTPHHLNPHVDYDTVPGPPAEIAQSLAFPMDMAFSADGQTVFVTAFGSRTLAVFDTDDLEAGVMTHDTVTVGGGPSGVVFDAARDRLYVLNRFDETISVISQASVPASRAQTSVVSVGFDPSPAVVRAGRSFLYDAVRSGHGDTACATCHLFGDFDSLAWDLGDPFGTVVPNLNPFKVGAGTPFHPMKGPMTTQSLRGLPDAGPMHWRGDRTAAGDPGGDAMDEVAAFKKFNASFVSLLGGAAPLSVTDLQSFTDFVMTLSYPPNPILALDTAFTGSQLNGDLFFFGVETDGGQLQCMTCHPTPLGTSGLSSVDDEPQEFKTPHLRNMYQKVGMFGVPSGVVGIPATGPFGAQVRGFGFLHDGSLATVNDFLNADMFEQFTPSLRRDVEAFVLAFDTGLRPSVGQQVSATPTTYADATVTARIDLLIARDDAGDCELVVQGVVANQARGWLYNGSNQFRSDRSSEPLLGKDALRAQAATAGQELMYTCTPPGSGTRMGVDRDGDGFFDRTEQDVGTDPADPNSYPGAPTTTTTTSSTTASTTSSTSTTSTSSSTTTTTGSTTTTSTLAPFIGISASTLTVQDDVTPPIDARRRKLSFSSTTSRDPLMNRLVPPARGSAGDPTIFGATVSVVNAQGSGEGITHALPAAGWRAIGGAPVRGYRYRAIDVTAAIQRLSLRADRLSLRGGGSGLDYTLDEPAQGAIALRLRLGTQTAWCANVPASTDVPGKFVGKKPTAPATTCPAAP